MEFTVEQQKAVDHSKNISAAVSASAGSGKTAVLVEHISKLITDVNNKVDADKIAAVTFTEKAAAELKSRLEKRIGELLEEDPQNEYYREQAARLSYAQISTISSFCFSLVKDSMRLLPLDDGVKVLDESEADILLKKAEKPMLKRIYTEFTVTEQNEIFRRLGGEKKVVQAVRDLNRFFSNLPDPVKWKNDQKTIFKDTKLFEKHYLVPCKEIISDHINEVIAKTDNVISKIRACKLQNTPFKKAKGRDALTYEQNLSNLAIKTEEYFNNFKDILQSSLVAFNKDDHDEFVKAVNADRKRMPAVKEIDELSKFIYLKDELKAEIDSFKDVPEVMKNYDTDRSECLEIFNMLCRLEEIFAEEHSRLKREENKVDFSDLEKYALQAVKSGAGKGRYKYIIVDEFQDSNDIQYEIFKELSDDEKNLFIVGDEKQCIYAFRNANPRIFTDLCNKSDKYINIKLKDNFRSSENVINTVNSLFSAPNKPKSFSENKWEDMICGTKTAACNENMSELVNIVGDDKNNDSELFYVAGRIQSMVKNGFTVHEEDGARPCRYGDFAVLARENKTAARLRKIMDDNGIPAVSVGEKDLTNLLEVEQVLAVLSAVIRPNDDLSTAKALMCPAYGFTAEDMARVRLCEGVEGVKDPKRGSLQFNLKKMNEQGGDDLLHKKISRFIADRDLLIKEAKVSNTSQLIRKLYSVTALDQIMSTGLKGKERMANLRILARYGKSYPRPADFLAAMKTIKKNNIKLARAQVKEQEERSVKLMTIHASKGLQFPVVFLIDTNESPNVKDKSDNYIFDAKAGAGLYVFDNEKFSRFQTVSHLLIEKIYTDKILGESLRLLYVGMTRAKEKLIVTASVTEKEVEKTAKKKDRETGEEKEETKVSVIRSEPAADSYYRFILDRLDECPKMMDVYDVQSISCAAEPENIPEAEQIDYDKIRDHISYKYPYEKLTKTPAKFTATALGVKPDEGGTTENTSAEAFYLGLPAFIKMDRPLTPKEIGDLYHKAMENMDFAASDAEAELRRLVDEGVLLEDERKQIKTEEIESFLSSDLCRRAGNAEEVCREFPVFTTVNKAETEDPSPDDLSFIQGIADMFFVEKREIVLVDYKTNRNTTEQKLTDEYKGQLEIYSKALYEMTGMAVKECWLYSFTLKRAIRVN